MSLDRRQLLLSGAAAGLATAAPGLALAATGDAAANAFFDKTCVQMLDDAPEFASSLGLDKGALAWRKSKLSDASWAGVEAKHKFCEDGLASLKALPDAGLSPAVKLNKDVVAYAMELGLEARPFKFGENNFQSAMSESSTPYVVSQQGGTYSDAGEFLDSQHSIETAADCDAYLARMHAVAVALDQETARVKADAAQGVIAPDFIMANMLGQMSGMLAVSAADSRFVSSLAGRAKAKGIAGEWSGQATKIVSGEIYPALTRQYETLKGLQPQSGHDAGVWRFKDGEAYYSWLLKAGTNTDMTAEQVHQTGLEQNKAIEARMDAILKANGLSQGTVGERMIALGNDPRFLFPDTDAGRDQIIAYLNQVIIDVRPKLASQFNLKLKAPVDVKRVPADIQDGAGQGYMNTGSLDGSRPSTYYINLKSTKNWPKFSLPTLTYHETVPGHAWQGAYLTETGQLPLIRILLSGFNAYVEGWALYAEQLGDEMGMYETNWAGQLGYLQAQRFRAIRLVVDTGLHAKRWTREQAIDWAVANSGRTRQAMTSEIDRYCGTPGQACGYKVGHNEINRLRDHAKQALGAKFDIRGFNDTVVKTGAVPISVLAAQIDALIAAGGKG
ncbi:DUF885 family protein [Phenylobacterium aquaticum]|uniref:DUF885 domain-containing protein n=1 Tax=Phenylobacterium aquaticum TaxID=1763816 RepID=UPI0026EA4764|nr:DUF885 family protein [Phenylobacterium aquaticum]